MGKRTSQHKGRVIQLSGASNNCLVWVDDKPVLGTLYRFSSLKRARAAAVSYIDRHAVAVAA